jgi:hypothetical protein
MNFAVVSPASIEAAYGNIDRGLKYLEKRSYEWSNL